MAAVVRSTPEAVLSAVASRRMDSARAFAVERGADRAFDSWRAMIGHDGIDAVYIATPTAPREEIAVAAAQAGKHVLAEKPFASLPSLQRITSACRENGVCFMDATHFVHHPRCAAVRDGLDRAIGRPRSLESRFRIGLHERGDIRYDPALEPLGALGDLGWYNLRATIEYLAPAGPLRHATAAVLRDERTGAVVAGEGLLTFEDGATSRWRCGFRADAVDIGLRLSGPLGTLRMDDFVGEDADGSASYRLETGGGTPAADRVVRVESGRSGPACMFAEFAAAAADPSRREQWMQASEKTQALLDAVVGAN
jgi:predicted dehydrogenase